MRIGMARLLVRKLLEKNGGIVFSLVVLLAGSRRSLGS